MLNPSAACHLAQRGAPLKTRTRGLVAQVASEAVAYVARDGDHCGAKSGTEKQRQISMIASAELAPT